MFTVARPALPDRGVCLQPPGSATQGPRDASHAICYRFMNLFISVFVHSPKDTTLGEYTEMSWAVRHVAECMCVFVSACACVYVPVSILHELCLVCPGQSAIHVCVPVNSLDCSYPCVTSAYLICKKVPI